MTVLRVLISPRRARFSIVSFRPRQITGRAELELEDELAIAKDLHSALQQPRLSEEAIHSPVMMKTQHAQLKGLQGDRIEADKKPDDVKSPVGPSIHSSSALFACM
jgi:hypothetical protein